MNIPKELKITLACVATFLTLVFAFLSFFTVDAYERTIVTRLGVVEYVADPGLHWRTPFITGTRTYRVDIQQISPDKQVNTYTVDNQEIDVTYTVFYRVPADKVAFIYTNVSDFKERLFKLTTDRLKTEMGKVNVNHVAEKRGELRDSIKVVLAEDAKIIGLEVVDFQLTDLQYTKSFRDAVENAAVQKANVEAQEYKKQQAVKDAEQAAIRAKGQADAARETAKGEADAKLLTATAEAKSIQLKGEAEATSIMAQTKALAENNKLVELRKAERWDGKLPQSMLSNVMPFMNVDAGAK
jgi:regulator of protease activity HflC (stomatin/prohibitin superfamily)